MFVPAEHIFSVMPYKKKGEWLREKELQSLLSLELIGEKRCPHSHNHVSTVWTYP